MPYCPDCGSEIDPDNVYCSNCGRQLDGGRRGESDSRGPGGDSHDAGGDDWSDTGDDWGGGTDDGSWSETDKSGQPDDWDDGGQYGNPPNQPPRGGQQGQGGGQAGGWGGGQGQAQRREWGGTNVQSGDDVYVEDGRVNYAVKFPFSDGWGALGISALCYLGSFLLVPLLIIWGYLYRVTEAAAWGDTLQPRFNEYGEMIKTGFFYILLYLVYAIVGVVVIGVLAVVGVESGVEAVGGLLALVVGVVFLYFGPAVLTLYPVTGSFSEALSPSRITDFAFTGKYFGSFLLYIALMFAVQLVFSIAFFALAITVIGILLVFPLSLVISPYLLYLTGSYWGATYYEAAQEGLVDPPWSEEDQPQQDSYGAQSDPAAEW